MLELITQAPQWLQIVLLVCALIGAVVIYKFRYIASLIAIGAVGVYMSLKRGKK